MELKAREWTKYKIQSEAQKIKEWNVKELVLGDNEHPNIIKEIEHIRFPSLQFISLFGNEISSIENLCRMYLPCLKEWISISTISDMKEPTTSGASPT